ncbi:MAG: hypothetical protein HC881_10230 [Leptolyngbyaceae cyanobacterium SL_7_1]|nr:hypothetical protein [Leptolyngbyaceae cyanobacterium SL_7_1]
MVSSSIATIYYTLSGNRHIFGSETTAPSYIPSDVFSIALLRQINFEQISQRISELTTHTFSETKLSYVREVLDDLRNSLGDNSLLQAEFTYLEQGIGQAIDDFKNRRVSLSTTIEQVSKQLIQFVESTETMLADNNHCKEIIRSRLPYLKQAILQRYSEPTVTEILQLIFHLAESNDFANERRWLAQKFSPQLAELILTLKQENAELLEHITDLPDQLKDNLIALAEQAQLKAEGLEASVRQLQREVADWFDKSMTRASGVYKRNAKGVALLIGFLIALSVNADTLYILNRLSEDSTLRSSLTQAVNQITPNSQTVASDLRAVRDAMDSVLDELPLPIGWDQTITGQQMSGQGIMPILRRTIGWLITGVALSMGAAFWYDTLSKVMNVRNTGGTGKSDSTR